MNHVDAPNVQAVLDVPDDLVELVSKQLWNVSEVSPDLLFVSRTWKNGLLPLLRSRKGWGRLQWVFYNLRSAGMAPVDYCIHRPCGQLCLFRNLPDTAVTTTDEGLCHVEYACDFKGDTLCVWFNATDPLVSKAKSAQVVALFEAENMTVTWPSGEGPFFVTLDDTDKAFLTSWKQAAGQERRSPCRSRPDGTATAAHRSPERCLRKSSTAKARASSATSVLTARSFMSPNRCPHCRGPL